ncbi:MAG: hypothetical protein NVS9B3_00050 [Gemmatimonadaceae bacterium]
MAIPRIGTTRDKAFVSSVKSDLRNVVTAEEACLAHDTTYTTTAALVSAGRVAVAVSTGASLADGAVDGQGWSATASDSYLVATKTCTVWVGWDTRSPPRVRGRRPATRRSAARRLDG